MALPDMSMSVPLSFFASLILVFSKIQVDLLEPVSHFLETARETLALGCQTNSDMHKAVNFYCVPLQVCSSSSCK